MFVVRARSVICEIYVSRAMHCCVKMLEPVGGQVRWVFCNRLLCSAGSAITRLWKNRRTTEMSHAETN